MQNTPNWTTSLLSKWRNSQPQTILEEQKEIQEAANDYDHLIHSKGWERVLKVGAERINSTLAEATRDPFDTVNNGIRIIRWNAMREVLDLMQDSVDKTRRDRDEINRIEEEIRQEQSAWQK